MRTYCTTAGVTDSFRQLRIDARHSLLVDIEALARAHKPLSFVNLLSIYSHQPHLTIVIAAGSMCAGVRVIDYLKSIPHDSRGGVLFVGYQVQSAP